MKKLTALLLALVMCLSLCACGGGEQSKKEEKNEEITSTQAINAVKNNKVGSVNWTEQKIAGALGFKQFASPDYGTTDAEQNSDGSWTVVLKGSMSGYTDDYRSDYDRMKFELEATVSYVDGDIDVDYVNVKEVY
ncbi:MAG: hypothetical protein IJ112_01115 [Oscillospiraceae bacterium]|nr:hypothetical protein [Clostridia bacterium]MBQ9044528.1 hypothetical protein [Oscillospiraceae bacterium]